MSTRILIVDDEQAFLNSVSRVLRLQGYTDVVTVENPTKVQDLLGQQSFDVAFLDITMPQLDGLDLLEVIKEQSPQTECIMITANESIPSVIRAIKLGAYDYLLKPIKPDQLIHSLERALERRRLYDMLLLHASDSADQTLENPEAFSSVITCDERMLHLLREAELHARSDIPVLITGETGVGKELMAQAIGKASRRNSGPFVAVNMLALNASLFESEFFGHAKGSFTGAISDKVGYLGKAKGGTLFLDEIGDLSLEIQGKLLRILQEGEYTPVGKTRTEKADVRFVAATNENLEKRVQQRKFRKDLFYRLRFANLHIPPLRERKDDIRLLAAHFLQGAGLAGNSLEEKAEARLVGHDWPGNVRELKGVLEAAANLAENGNISPKHLNLPHRTTMVEAPASVGQASEVGALEPLAEVERRHILSVYQAVGNNKSQCARVLGIGLQTLHRKLKAYNVS